MKIYGGMYDYTGSQQTSVGDKLMYEFEGYSPFTEIKQLIKYMKAKMLHILESSNIEMENLSVELYGDEGYEALYDYMTNLINKYEIDGIYLDFGRLYRDDDGWQITIVFVKITNPFV